MDTNLLGTDGQNNAPKTAEAVDLLQPEPQKKQSSGFAGSFAIGPFGQWWLWLTGILLTTIGLWKLIGGAILTHTLPTAKAVITGYVTVPGRNMVEYAPQIQYQVAGKSYQFVSG